MSSLPEELSDFPPIPPTDNKFFRPMVKNQLQNLLTTIYKAKKYDSVIANHQRQIEYHQEKIKESELRKQIYQNQITIGKERVKKLLEEVWDDINSQ